MQILSVEAHGHNAGESATDAPRVQVSADLAELVTNPTQFPVGFEEWFAAERAENPTFDRHLSAMTAEEWARDLRYRVRTFAYESSQIYADAYRIKRFAELLHGFMERFVEQYDGTEGIAALEALGVKPPGRGDNDETAEPEERFSLTHAMIRGHLFNVGELVGGLNEIGPKPVRRKGGVQ